MATIRETPATPPMTPPAMAPAWLLEEESVDISEVDEVVVTADFELVADVEAEAVVVVAIAVDAKPNWIFPLDTKRVLHF
jgi:hypothetical protein